MASLSSFIGVDGINPTPNSGRFLINLKPHGQRPPADKVIAALRERLAGQPGIALYLQPVQDLTLENRVSRTQYQFTLEGADLDELNRWTGKLVDRLRQRPEFAEVTSDVLDQGRQVFVNIDRATASRLGVSTAAIDNALYSAYGQRLVSTIFTQANQYRVVLEVDPAEQTGPQDLQGLRIPSTNGSQVPLSAIAELSERPTTLAINHLDQYPVTTVSFNLAPGYALGDAVAAVEAAKQDVELPLAIRSAYQAPRRPSTPRSDIRCG